MGIGKKNWNTCQTSLFSWNSQKKIGKIMLFWCFFGRFSGDGQKKKLKKIENYIGRWYLICSKWILKLCCDVTKILRHMTFLYLLQLQWPQKPMKKLRGDWGQKFWAKNPGFNVGLYDILMVLYNSTYKLLETIRLFSIVLGYFVPLWFF